jgi:hypothetical protein
MVEKNVGQGRAGQRFPGRFHLSSQDERVGGSDRHTKEDKLTVGTSGEPFLISRVFGILSENTIANRDSDREEWLARVHVAPLAEITPGEVQYGCLPNGPGIRIRDLGPGQRRRRDRRFYLPEPDPGRTSSSPISVSRVILWLSKFGAFELIKQVLVEAYGFLGREFCAYPKEERRRVLGLYQHLVGLWRREYLC